MPRSDLPIGVFDSGVGGLTVLTALAARLPHEHLLYLGDTARVPYGTRSAATVQRYAERVAGHLVRRGVKALVIACNTATTYALDALSAAGDRLGVPVIGVIQPGVRRAVQHSTQGRIGVIGTEGTVRGGAYERALMAAAPHATTHAIACPLFVALAEEGWTEGPIAALTAARYLAPLIGQVDTLILGCTHYPLLAPVIAAALPGVTLIDSATAVADATAEALDVAGLSRRHGAATQRYLVTDNLDRFRRVGERFMGMAPDPVELIDLTDEDAHALRTMALGA